MPRGWRSAEGGRPAAHLVGLCCGVEAPGEQDLYWAIPRWLDGRKQLTRPADIAARGETTICHVPDPANEADYPELVRTWARSLWDAYADQHATAGNSWPRCAPRSSTPDPEASVAADRHAAKQIGATTRADMPAGYGSGRSGRSGPPNDMTSDVNYPDTSSNRTH